LAINSSRAVLVLTLALTLAGCGLFGESTVDEPTAEAKAEADSKAAAAKTATIKDEQELKLARLWARVDELEEEQARSKERLAIVEKGVILGILPEELRRPEHAKKGKTKGSGATKEPAKVTAKDSTKKAEEVDEATASQGAVHPKGDAVKPVTSQATEGKPKAATDSEPRTPSGLNQEDADAYQKALATAHDLFRSGRYGAAVVEYSDIGKRFGEQVGGGMHIYWTAKCWANLKEYNTARQLLTEFLKDHAKSPWVPRAKFELGRIEWQLGMQETALRRFRDIIQQHPYEDAAEMAKMELQTLDKKL
jgi:TolA-binding protein